MIVCECGIKISPPYPDKINCPCGKTGSVADFEIKKAKTFSNNPGTALESLIPEWVVQFKKGCGCKDYSKKMDRWGTDGCLAREKEIVGHLMGQSDKLIPIFRGIPKSLREAAAKKLLAKAIEISRKV